MCSIFRCFGWIIDLIQRMLSFMMAGVMFCVICFGCIIAAGAGVAYGYNVSLAEYLDLKRADVTVYVRRGQFSDKPDVSGQFRRSGEGDDNELFASNYSVDYQDHKIRDDTKPLSEAWEKAQNTRNYADKLTKYSKLKPSARSNKDGDDLFDDLAVGDRATLPPPFEKLVRFVPEQTGDELKMRRPNEGPPFGPFRAPVISLGDDTDQQVLGLRSRNVNRKPKRKRPDITIDLDDKSAIFHRNASKFLYTQEDFDDADENTNIGNTPL